MAGSIPFHRVIEVTMMLSDGVEWLCGKNEWMSDEERSTNVEVRGAGDGDGKLNE